MNDKPRLWKFSGESPWYQLYAHGFPGETSGIPLWKQAIILPVPMVVIFLIMVYFRNQRDEGIYSAG